MMKRVKSLWPLLAVLLMSFAIVSCEENDEDLDAKVYGAWKSVYVESWEKSNGEIVDETSGAVTSPFHVLVVRRDDSVNLLWNYGDGFELDDELNYADYKGDVIVFHWEGWNEVVRVKSVSDDELVLESHQFEEQKYVTKESYTKIIYKRSSMPNY